MIYALFALNFMYSLSRSIMDNSNVIYVLKLENSKFYVGRTKNSKKRISAHKHGRGSAWTAKYKPIDVLNLYDNCDSYDEDKYTLKLMAEHGIENVRGGSYVQIHLPELIISDIERRIRMATDRCLNCGSKDHFVTKCIRKRKSEEKETINTNKKSRFLSKLEKNFIGCEICMKDDHFTSDCSRS